MAGPLTITVNEKKYEVRSAPDTPLLYVLRNELNLNGPRLGCGLEQCGACTVLLGARAIRSCKTPVGEATNGMITTLEGLGSEEEFHPIQQAFIDEQAAQCGYCTNGMIMVVAQLLGKNHHPTDEQIRSALDENLCRCGSHVRILRAARRAAALMWGEPK
jgi:nicotinate dehydrogenase subunit A